MSVKTTVLTGIATAFMLALPASAQESEPNAGTVLARVGDTEITLGHLIAEFEMLPPEYRQLDDDVLFEGLLEQLVEQTAVRAMAGAELDLRTRLMVENRTNDIIVNNLLIAHAQSAVSDEAVEALYQERYVDIERDLEYNLAHILLHTEEDALELLAQIEDGADFADLAREHSRDTTSGEIGGDAGWIGLGRSFPEIDEAMQTLEVGEISAPVATEIGWHILRLLDVRETPPPPLEEVQNELAGELRQIAALDLIQEAIESVPFEMLDDGIDPGLIRNRALLDE